ncbi:hypothetical protein SAMD00079811_37550 [Scytonema sp. HK-05]|uniref:hypothetical protein n=1 Tax=Scytonema sp. HK-05 TaxID=1137095 RepID=UPI000935E999|nr:hypothetical protein [Scytonema sp. HK-05]OKH59371.1 hypothetical protein NIES2130_09785 [Scytonema sp. HK-05]BAY46147.1 hypothetical protein SAMD00079811_37550 [Scytonema sp. HK-05]
MSSGPDNSSNTNLLGSFASLLGVLAIFLYFVGWIYRWAYFGFFEIEITALNFPFESFLLVPIQVILGDFWIFVRSLLVLIITILLIKFSLWVIRSPKTGSPPSTLKSPISSFTQKVHSFRLFQPLRSFAQLLPLPLRHEIIVVAWILAALFWLGRWQGTADAFRDAVNTTSTRPIVTLVSPKDKSALGLNLQDLTNADLNNSRIIGDVEQFRRIYERGTNDTTTNPKQPIVWRLLIENNNWVYVFPAMPPDAKRDQRPPVLAINTGDGQVQVLILSRPKMLP